MMLFFGLMLLFNMFLVYLSGGLKNTNIFTQITMILCLGGMFMEYVK